MQNQTCIAPDFAGEVVSGISAKDREPGRQNTKVKVGERSFFLVFNVVPFRSRGEMAARVFEKQADIELRREEWREEVVKTKKRALEVTET